MNSPVDITAVDAARFPRFPQRMPPLSCVVSEGEGLYLPSFWWHEVQSAPGAEGVNTAANLWYEPFYTREYPCAECELHVNPSYYSDL